jgi:hypothetical protein
MEDSAGLVFANYAIDLLGIHQITMDPSSAICLYFRCTRWRLTVSGNNIPTIRKKEFHQVRANKSLRTRYQRSFLHPKIVKRSSFIMVGLVNWNRIRCKLGRYKDSSARAGIDSGAASASFLFYALFDQAPASFYFTVAFRAVGAAGGTTPP